MVVGSFSEGTTALALRGPSGGGSGHTLYLQHEGGGGGLVGNNSDYAHMVEGGWLSGSGRPTTLWPYNCALGRGLLCMYCTNLGRLEPLRNRSGQSSTARRRRSLCLWVYALVSVSLVGMATYLDILTKRIGYVRIA